MGHRSSEGPETTVYCDNGIMRKLRWQFRLRTLLLAVVLAAVILEVYVLSRPPMPEYGSVPPQFGQRQLRVGRLIHSGEWDIAPDAIPNLIESLRNTPAGSNLMVTEKDLFPSDPNLIYYSVFYFHGRTTGAFTAADFNAVRRQLERAGSTLFADADCGSPAFDAGFRRFVGTLLPKNPLVPIPTNDVLYTTTAGADLSQVQYTKAAGGHRDFPQLEGVKIKGHWAVIYSKYGIGCTLDHDHDGGCKGYSREDAAKIGRNVLIYSTLP
jgi:Domain of unknown function (DUF4159)